MTDRLEEFSRALEVSAVTRQEAHAEFNRRLAKQTPVLWLPDPEDERFGIGWFRADKGFISFRRYANGYDPNSRFVLEDTLLLALIPSLKEEMLTAAGSGAEGSDATTS